MVYCTMAIAILTKQHPWDAVIRLGCRLCHLKSRKQPNAVSLSAGFRALLMRDFHANCNYGSHIKIDRQERAAVIGSKDDLRSTSLKDDPTALVTLDFTSVYQFKSTQELLRGIFVFQLCSVDWVVNNQLVILHWLQRLLGTTLFKYLMKKTVYGQFLAGETKPEILTAAKMYLERGVSTMFTYTAAEVHGQGSDTMSEDALQTLYHDNLQEIHGTLELAAASKEIGNVSPKVTTKITFLTPVDVLKTLNTFIEYNIRYISSMISNDKRMQEIVQTCFSACTSKPGSPKLGKSETATLTSMLRHLPFHIIFAEMASNNLKDYKNTPIQLDEVTKLHANMDTINKSALRLGVRIGWDAEQTYLQSAIDVLILDSMRRFNTSHPVVIGTYQCYLKDAYDKVSRDLNIAERDGFAWSGKIVRGAYMIEERRIALEHGYNDPVNPSYDATTVMYDRVMDLVLSKVQSDSRQYNVTFATHNETTCQRVLERMKVLNIPAGDASISIAQLFGMRDHLTLALGICGAPAEKLLHYGPVMQGIAYLSRRLNENRSGMPAADKERDLMWAELKKRLRSKRHS